MTCHLMLHPADTRPRSPFRRVLTQLLLTLTNTFPECVNNHMNGVECKSFIDEEILTLFSGEDRMTRTIISGKRSIMDFFYNSVVIYMDDEDIVTGRDGDGLIYYDL